MYLWTNVAFAPLCFLKQHKAGEMISIWMDSSAFGEICFSLSFQELDEKTSNSHVTVSLAEY